jgi:hypothetical protein
MEIRGPIHRVIDAGRFPTAFVPAWDAPGPGEIDGTAEALANANLIAATPDLLDALVAFVYRTTSLSPQEDDGSHWCRIPKTTLNKARAAIARATGAEAVR